MNTAEVKLAKGKLQLTAVVLGKTGGITVVPPNTGTAGCLLFEITGGDRYHVLFPSPPSSTIKTNDAKTFQVKNVLVQGLCSQLCTPGAPGCGWHDGDMIVYPQASWGDVPDGANIASVLAANYGTIYAPFGIFEVGVSGGMGFSMVFDGSDALNAYLPAVGVDGPLDSDLFDPLASAAGGFGGEVAALKLNVDFSDAGITHGTASAKFGDLQLCNFIDTPEFNGTSVREFLAFANNVLGGIPASETVAAIAGMARQLNSAFFEGIPASFAQGHLVDGACP